MVEIYIGPPSADGTVPSGYDMKLVGYAKEVRIDMKEPVDPGEAMESLRTVWIEAIEKNSPFIPKFLSWLSKRLDGLGKR